MRLEQGKVISDRYEVQEQLGSGGMAIVYRALDMKLDRSVTLKVMRDDLEEGFIDRFYKEAQSIASLSHTNIVKVYDYGEDNGIHYIVMEYVDGTTLKELIIKKAPFDEESTLGVAIQIVKGLLHAHKNDVIHRDIKPQNILVTHEGAVKIADFGIARAAKASTLTSNANSMGSVHYFSPEQARGGFVDHRSDIYALGVTIFEMVTGKLPFDGDAAVVVALKHINEPFPDPQDVNPNVTDHIRHIILRATEKSSTKRYAAIEDMCRDIKKTISNVELLEPPNFEDSPTVIISKEEREVIRKNSRDYTTRHDYTEELRKAYADDDEREEKSDRKMLIAALSTAAVFVAIITLASFWIYNSLKPQFVSPPNIVGMSLDQATVLAEPLGLNVVQLGTEFSDNHELGLIVEQLTHPEDALRRGDDIHVIISLGSEFFSLPDVIHTTVDDATNRLHDMQLEVNINPYDNVEFPRDTVVSTEPEPGSMVSTGDVITLHVSLGAENSRFPMPLLRGEATEIEAIRILQDLGLTVAPIERNSSIFYDSGIVMRQSVDPGEPVIAGDIIQITISTGNDLPAPTPTPSPDPTATNTPTPSPDPTATNTATPSPLPTTGIAESAPTPSPAPTPAPASPETELIQSTLNIALWEVPTGTESVHLLIYKQAEGDVQERIVNYEVNVDTFPFSMSISGTGHVTYRIFSVEADGSTVHRSTTTVNFSELSNA